MRARWTMHRFVVSFTMIAGVLRCHTSACHAARHLEPGTSRASFPRHVIGHSPTVGSTGDLVFVRTPGAFLTMCRAATSMQYDHVVRCLVVWCVASTLMSRMPIGHDIGSWGRTPCQPAVYSEASIGATHRAKARTACAWRGGCALPGVL